MRGVPGGVWLVTDRRQARLPLPQVVAAAVDGGVRTVLLREKDLPVAERRALARALRGVLAPVGGCLLVAGPDPLGGDGCHLPAHPDAAPKPDAAAEPDPVAAACAGRAGGGLRGWSWHGEGEVPATVDYVTLSPVYASRSKPGYGPALGPARLARAAAGLRRATPPVPVVALGGIATPAQVVDCLAAGAHAVAALGALMRADDPAAAAATLVRAARRPPVPRWDAPPARPAPPPAPPARPPRAAAGTGRVRGSR
ncbi:MAG TPA: thiamine phosphate synthase [Pilimelia sp.]|nr:thiamine phosphate synthase [Pilimelia sp.]